MHVRVCGLFTWVFIHPMSHGPIVFGALFALFCLVLVEAGLVSLPAFLAITLTSLSASTGSRPKNFNGRSVTGLC